MAHWKKLILGAVVLAFFAVLVAEWPGWTLRYADVLAWPVVVAVGLVAVGPALARRVPDLRELQLPGGVVATFDQAVIVESTELLTAAELWGPVIDGTEAGPPSDVPTFPGDGDSEATLANEAVRVLATIVGAYAIQLELLSALENAPAGLTHAAVRSFLSDAIAARGHDPNAEDLEKLIAWPVGEGALTLAPDGTYRLTDRGHRVVAALSLPALFVAPKLI